MAPSMHMEVRPRSTGEILDDAWRLYRSSAPLLLAATGLFLLPAATALVLTLTQPLGESGWLRRPWPALAALLLPLTGLGAGACQEVFHLWTEDRPVTLSRCLRAALRRGWNHVASEALVLLLPLFGLLCFGATMASAPAAGWTLLVLFLLFNMPVWAIGFCRHAVLTAGQRNLWRGWRLSRRAMGRHFGPATLLLFCRLVLLVAIAVNLHLFLVFGLQAAEQFAGLDVAYLRLLVALANPIYLLLLLCLSWWLLAPYNEAVNYLFLVDDRARYDGLDLWFAIDEHFPRTGAVRAGALLLAAGALLLAPTTAPAAERLETIQKARKDLAVISREVKAAEPYPGGDHWRQPLLDIAQQLDPDGTAERGRYRWFYQGIDRLGQGDQAGAGKVLQDMDARLALVEQSLKWQPFARRHGEAADAPQAEDVRKLVPRGAKTPTKERVEKKPPVEQDGPPQRGGPVNFVPSGGAAPGIVAPASVGGLGHVCLMIFGILVVVVLAFAIVLWVRNWVGRKPRPKPGMRGVSEPALEDVLAEPDRQNVASLWRQSDELARAGRFLEAVRTLYLAVLALLHQASLIRYERTRTNGEYADQLRRKRSPTHSPFRGLTGIFEVKWYGERACRPEDYNACRGLADTIQREAAAPIPNP